MSKEFSRRELLTKAGQVGAGALVAGSLAGPAAAASRRVRRASKKVPTGGTVTWALEQDPGGIYPFGATLTINHTDSFNAPSSREYPQVTSQRADDQYQSSQPAGTHAIPGIGCGCSRSYCGAPALSQQDRSFGSYGRSGRNLSIHQAPHQLQSVVSGPELFVLPDGLAFLNHGTQAFLHVFQVHQLVEIEIL
jgi:hypothetical protein